jgi:lysozyme
VTVPAKQPAWGKRLAISAAMASTIAVSAPPVLNQLEGYRTVVVHERIDPPGVYTVCAGITNYDMPELKIGQRFTEAQCNTALAKAVPKYIAQVNKCIHVELANKDTALAMVLFVYNVGQGNLCKSSVARKINAGDLKGGCNALMAWDMADGKHLKGLRNRRAIERDLCLKGLEPPPAPPKPSSWWGA